MVYMYYRYLLRKYFVKDGMTLQSLFTEMLPLFVCPFVLKQSCSLGNSLTNLNVLMIHNRNVFVIKEI